MDFVLFFKTIEKIRCIYRNLRQILFSMELFESIHLYVPKN